MRALCGLGVALAILLLAECLLRVLGLPPQGPPPPDRVGLLGDERAAFFREVFLHGPSLHPRLRPRAEASFTLVDPAWRIAVRIDAEGLRMRPLDPARPRNTFRIVCLGDDHAFGWGVAEDSCYPRVLEKLLREAFPACHIEVLNAGVPGFTSTQVEGWLPEVLQRFDPQVVILGCGANDTRIGIGAKESDLRKWERWRRAEFPSPALRAWLRRSALYGWMWEKMARRGWAGAWARDALHEGDPLPRRVPPQELREHTLTSIAWAQARGVTPIVLHLDLMQDVALEPLRDAAQRTHSAFVDGRSLLEPTPDPAPWKVEAPGESTSGGPPDAVEVMLAVRLPRDGGSGPWVLSGFPDRLGRDGLILGRLRDDGREGDVTAGDGIGTARIYAKPGDWIRGAVSPQAVIQRLAHDPRGFDERFCRRWSVPEVPPGTRLRAAPRDAGDDPLAPYRLEGHPHTLSPEGHRRVARGLFHALLETRVFQTHRRRCGGGSTEKDTGGGPSARDEGK